MATIKDTYVLDVKTDKASRGLGSAKGAALGLGTSLAKVGPLAAGAVAALGGFAAISGIKSTIDDMDALAKSARLAGVAVGEEGAFKDFQVLKQAMNEAGVDAGTFERGMMQLNTRLKAGSEGQKSYAKIVDKLGDSIRDQSGNLLTGAEAMEVMINKLNDGTITTEEFAKVVGGRAGPVIQQQFAELQEGATGLAATLADVEANSNIVSSDAAENAEVFNDTIGRLGEAAGQLGTDISTALLPILVDLAEGALAMLPGVIETVKAGFENLKPIIEALQPVFSALWELLQALQPAFQLLFDILGPVAEVIGGALTMAIEGVTTVIQTVIGVIETMVEKLGAISDKVSEISGAVGGKFKEMKDSVVGSAKDTYDGVTGWFGDMYDEVVGNSIVPDMAEEVIRTMSAMSGGMTDEVAQGAIGVVREMDNIATGISGGFGQYADSALSGISQLVDSVSGGLMSKLNGLYSSVKNSFSGIFDIFGGSGSSGGGSSSSGGFLSNLVGDLFAGFFAQGGIIPGGQFGVVGERGPELVTGPAQITPLTGMGGSQNVTYNINAVDAQSFKNLIAQDPGFIHAVAQRGGRLVPGGR